MVCKDLVGLVGPAQALKAQGRQGLKDLEVLEVQAHRGQDENRGRSGYQASFPQTSSLAASLELVALSAAFSKQMNQICFAAPSFRASTEP